MLVEFAPLHTPWMSMPPQPVTAYGEAASATRQAWIPATAASGSVQPNVCVLLSRNVPAAKFNTRLVPVMAYVLAVPREISGP